MENVITPDELAEKGDRIYDKIFRDYYEKHHDGKFLAVDIENNEAYLGEHPETALDLAKKSAPNGVFYLVKIGAATAFYIGYTGERNYGMGR